VGDLTQKWMAARDPVHHGRTRYGIATGLSARCGTQWIATRGLFLLCRGTAVDALNQDQPIGASPVDHHSVQPFAGIGQTPGETYYYTVVPVGRGGVGAVPNPFRSQIVKVMIDDDGDAPEPVPAAPRRLAATVIAAGKFKLAWDYVPRNAGVQAAKFNIYNNAGAGAMDYDTIVATVTARAALRGAGKYTYVTAAFDHETSVVWAVRAADASDHEEKNTQTVTAQADAQGPAVHKIYSATYGADE